MKKRLFAAGPDRMGGAGRGRRSMAGRGRMLAAGLAGGAAVVLAACGSSGPGGAGVPAAARGGRSPETLIAQMQTAVAGATSMHMSGQLSSDGRPVAVDLGVLRSGPLTGTITQNGIPLHLIDARGQVYVQATPAFLHELKASAVCSVMCGKYVEMTGSQGRDLAASLSMASLTHALLAALPRFARDGTTTVGGQAAVVLHGTDGSTLTLAAVGQPYPLRVSGPASHPEKVEFSQWNAVTAPAAPPAHDVINLNQLKARTS